MRRLSLICPFILLLTAINNIQGQRPETIEKAKATAANSPVVKYSWKDRGPAPIGYLKGLAVSFAHSYYELKTGKKTAIQAVTQPLGPEREDALTHYGLAGATPTDRLVALYTLAMGLGMRESSGNTTEGWDTSKEKSGITNTEYNAEAGLFQVSWDSHDKSPWLLTLYSQYQAAPARCSLAIFMDGLKDKKIPETGTGEGAQFQKFTKQCPSFATEYALIMLRVKYRHFGPVIRKEAEYNLDVEKMFRAIEKAVDEK